MQKLVSSENLTEKKLYRTSPGKQRYPRRALFHLRLKAVVVRGPDSGLPN